MPEYITDPSLLAQLNGGGAARGDPFEAALKAEGADPKIADIARSIYQQESGAGKNTKTSNAGAVGGMQIIPATFSSVADKDWSINDPTQNARAGIRYIKQLYDQAGGDPALTAAGYYGGPGGLEKARRGVAVSDPRNPNAPTTLQYGQQVAARLPKEQPGIVQRAVEAVIPSAQAAEAAPPRQYIDDPELLAQLESPAAEPAKKKGMGVGEMLYRGVNMLNPAGAVLNVLGSGDPVKDAKDVVGGGVRGAGSIGATLVAPYDYAVDAIKGDRGKQLSTLVTGKELPSRNAERRASMDAALSDLGADTKAPLYQGAKLGAEVAGTAGVGNALAVPLRAAGAAAPVIGPAMNRLATSVASGGLSVGPGGGTATNALARIAGGATTGGAAAGLVNPEDARTGAIIGGALPAITQVAGAVGRAAGRTLSGPTMPESTIAAATAARDAGYVLPPTQVRPTLGNRLLEGISGKITTAQNASVRNQEVTNRLAREAIGAQELTPEAIQAVRKSANEAYTTLGNAGAITTDDAFRMSIAKAGDRGEKFAKDFPELMRKDADTLLEGFAGKESFDAQSAIEAIKRLREGQRAGLKAFDDADKKAYARVQGQVADALENLVERNLEKTGRTDLLTNFRDARQTLAKAYDVEKALNPTTGNVDAAKLSALLKKGRPLSGELKTAAEFGGAFPKAAQTPERMGSLPQTSPLDWGAAAGLSLGTGSPLGLLGLVARPGARAATLSPFVQNRLLRQSQPGALARLSANPEAQQLLYRTAPVAGSQ